MLEEEIAVLMASEEETEEGEEKPAKGVDATGEIVHEHSKEEEREKDKREKGSNTIGEVMHEHSEGDESSDSSYKNSEEGYESRDASEENSSDKIGSFEQSSPRGVLEVPVRNVDSDSSSSSNGGRESFALEKTSASDCAVLESYSAIWRSLFSGLLLRRKRRVRRLATFPLSGQRPDSKDDLVKIPLSGDHINSEAKRGRHSWRDFDYHELLVATNNFSPDKLIGKGGHAEVYKGCLSDGQLVAVKKLTKGKSEEQTRDFLTELGIVAHADHPNVAPVVGFCSEEGLHLVLQFSPHGSLASVLHCSKKNLDWGVRLKIALGVAEGLLYLHEGCHRRIIHRDIKASNILLTQDYQPQIADFGLAKWLPDKLPHLVVFPVEGTFGYMAPEYFMDGVVNEKTDVFAFGVLLLELITGRRAVDSSQQDRQSLVMWVRPYLATERIPELVDLSLDTYDQEEMKRTVLLASMCIHDRSTSRPDMNTVVRLLRGEEGSTELGNKVLNLVGGRLPMFEASDSDYTCSRYLMDLNRHKELALEQ